MNADDLTPGDVIRVNRYTAAEGDTSTTVEILRPQEPWTDRFGRAMFRYWARRHDTGAEGWMSYGPGGIVTPAERGQ